MIFQN